MHPVPCAPSSHTWYIVLRVARALLKWQRILLIINNNNTVKYYKIVNYLYIYKPSDRMAEQLERLVDQLL